VTEQELRKAAAGIQSQMYHDEVSDEEILRQVEKLPELLRQKLPSGANLFLGAVSYGRFPLALKFAEMGADVHWRSEASGIGGNALNAAWTPEQADRLLVMGLEIERNLSPRLPCRNPAITAAGRNDKEMTFYWLKKQKRLFAGEPDYLDRLVYATIEMVAMVNQWDMLAWVLADDELFAVLRDIYARVDNETSIKLRQSALRHIKEESLEPRKKELRKILNGQKKNLSERKDTP